MLIPIFIASLDLLSPAVSVNLNVAQATPLVSFLEGQVLTSQVFDLNVIFGLLWVCLLYTSDAADDLLCVGLGGRRSIQKKKRTCT